jgi:hypothetical protein
MARHRHREGVLMRSRTRNTLWLVAAAVGGAALVVLVLLVAAYHAYDGVLNAVMGGR